MKYGTYNISLSIGYSSTSREAVIDVSDYCDLSDWQELSETEQSEYIHELMYDTLGSYIEYSCTAN